LKLEQRELIGAPADLPRSAHKRAINTGTATESVIVTGNYPDAS
jgi:hypothetical protein